MISLVFKLVFSVQIYDILNYDILYNRFYIITQVILAFWLVLSYDVLKDRGTIDVVITEFFPRCFKMAERFEKLDNILRVWAKKKKKKGLPRHLNRFEKHQKKKDRAISFRKWFKYLISLSWQSRETKPSIKLVLVSQELLPYLEFNKPDKQDFLRLNEIASFCLDNRLRQVALFRVRQSGHRPAQALCWRILK